jgi:hypothetical protein
MTKRLSAGVLLFVAAMFVFAVTANAERLTPREWTDKSDPYRGLPLFFRSAAGTTFVQVNSTGGCDPALVTAGGDIHDGSTHTSGQVFCFEGPDSLWPAGPGGTQQDEWGHWSRNLPPIPLASKWHITTLDGHGGSGTFTSWCGCDSLGTNPSCDDVTFWVNKKGYGNEWEFSQILDVSNLGASSGGTLEFDVRYDSECVYDYLYLEYHNGTTWAIVLDSAGTAAVFNGVSGSSAIATNTCDGGNGGATDGNIYNDGTITAGGNYHGNSTWYTNVTFPVPAVGNLKFRWRGFSDPAWSDEDGRGDTDGIAAIDNVTLTFNNGTVVNDNFEFGDYVHVTTTNGGGNQASWAFEQGGNTYDGWHLTFDPMYKNKGNTCTFSNDWMWAAKPDAAAIPENQFEFFLTSPVIPCNGWTGGTVLYSNYQCLEDPRDDYSNQHMRFYDASKASWSPWQDFDGFISFAGCEFWSVNDFEDLTPFLGTTIDSLQLGFELLDPDQPGDFSWGKHANVQYVIDKVAFGSYDGTGTVFTARNIDLFADTFSRADPAHTPFLQNAEQANWNHAGGTRLFADSDSLNVAITDFNGLTSQNVDIFWRVNTGHGTGFGGWQTKAVHFSVQDATRPAGEGTYRTIIGADDGGVEDETASGDGLIWNAGQTVEYYITVDDDAATPLSYFPGTADPATVGGPTYFEFSILPFDIATSGTVATSHTVDGRPVPIGPAGTHFVLLVDDYTRNALDFQNSTGFNPTGGIGQGAFTTPVLDQPEDMAERALALLYGGSETNPHWDKYDVLGAGSSVQCEPRGVSDVGNGLGAYMTDNPLIIYYDALIWLQGTFDAYSYADTTRLELANFLERGGCLFSTGDQVAFHLGVGGNDADSLIGFGVEYFGFAFTNVVDETTVDRVLNITGEAGTSMAGLELGIYAECPIRSTPDRMFLSVPVGDGVPRVLGRYTDGSFPNGSDNTRVCFTKCDQPGVGGTAAHLAFGIENLLDDVSRARLLGRFLGTDCGLTVNAVVGNNDGVDAPLIANGFGFNLAEARPNPFSSETSIQFSVPANTHVKIEVYNILGQKVRTLVDENMEANSYVRDWDGRSDQGAEVSSGIYFYKMVAGDFSATKKAVLLK